MLSLASLGPGCPGSRRSMPRPPVHAAADPAARGRSVSPRARTSAGRAAGGRMGVGVGVTAAAARPGTASWEGTLRTRSRRRRRSPPPETAKKSAASTRCTRGWVGLATTSSVARSPRAQPLTVLTHPSINPSTVARPVLTCRGSASAAAPVRSGAQGVGAGLCVPRARAGPVRAHGALALFG